MKALLNPTCFPSIAQFVAIIKADKLYFEVCDNYQKQTYRNRAFIYGANGKLQLNIPVHHTHKARQLYKDVLIANTDNWQELFLKSLQSAYNTSPFYEFYIDEIQPLFEIKTKYLMDFNFKCLDVLMDCLQIEVDYKTTQQFEKTPIDKTDLRHLANSRKETPQTFDTYTQVFSDKHGFISNLSILDLLFNEGTNTVRYLEAQNLSI